MCKIGHDEFLRMLAVEFPELVDEVRDEGAGLLHLEAAALRRATERAMDAGQLWATEKHFRFVERVMRDAGSEVENALSVSYLEDLALGECTPERYRAVKERMPAKMREEMVGIHTIWR